MTRLYQDTASDQGDMMMERLVWRPTSNSFTLKLCHGELSNRFSQTRLNGMPVAAAIEKLLLDAANSTLEDSNIPEVITLYTKFLDIPHLSIQLKMIPDLVKAYNEENQPICRATNVCTICEILNSVSTSKTMFKQVCNLIKILLTVPVTTATSLRQLKTFLRSTMLQTTLNYVMLLNKERTDLLDIKEIAKQFISVNNRSTLVVFEIVSVNFVIIILFLL